MCIFGASPVLPRNLVKRDNVRLEQSGQEHKPDARPDALVVALDDAC